MHIIKTQRNRKSIEGGKDVSKYNRRRDKRRAKF